MAKMLKGLTLVSVVAVLVAGLMFAGCSTNSPLSPNNNNNIEQLSSAKTIVRTASRAISVSVQKSIVAVKGGGINIDDNEYHHLFVVKSSAIPQDTVISIVKTHDTVNGKLSIIFTFGPNGLVFSPTSDLSVDMNELNKNATTAYLYYFDVSANKWVFQDSKPVENGKATFDIRHFSRYAISD